MGVPFSVILEEASRLLVLPLNSIGFSFEPKSYTVNAICWFIKKPEYQGDLYRIIWLQPSGFSEADLFDLAVNLTCCQDRDGIHPPSVRLSPYFWGTGTEMDYWWHFTNRSELQGEMLDIQKKLIEFGVPYLKHINTFLMVEIATNKYCWHMTNRSPQQMDIQPRPHI